MSQNRLITVPLITILACVGLVGCSTGEGSEDQSDFEVFSWWTSGSESDALDVLLTSWNDAYPSGRIVNGAIAGSGGTNAQTVLQSRLAGGDLPNTWQAYIGTALQEYVQSGLVADLTQDYESAGIIEQYPDAIIDALSTDGAIYGVVPGAQRSSMLWYNPTVLQDAGVTIDPSMSFADFAAALDAVKASGVTPLCEGDNGGFGSRTEFEAILLANLTADQWNDLFAGDLQWDSAPVREAIDSYVALRDDHNSNAASLEWTDAVSAVADGECAGSIMGDWAYGELMNRGYEEGVDFEYMPVPGSDEKFNVVADVFAVSESAGGSEGAAQWVEVLSDPQVQVEFSAEKGSIPVRTDADVSSLSTYQQAAATDFADEEVTKVLSFHAGSLTSPAYVQAFRDGLVSLNSSGDVDEFIGKMSTAAAE